MKSLGVIETRGFVAAIQAVDAACKAAGVNCIGYRKVGSGIVSVCFEGEISAIHTAIERGVAVTAAEHHVSSLVIARPERCVVEALSTLKGMPSPAAKAELSAAVKTEEQAPLPAASVAPATQPTLPGEAEETTTTRKGKKA
ncbi:BMC domain-containing protein [Erwinia sorbitola]|uniref:BMC domain-containing protein n=1 Tax=Erwinia sorbitola TaxID=2681984 RepID=A0A6I6EFC5_9GAMM|nr:BMC domain-containing protein [Erwinia sorbitola]MTD26996.1 BMC domain-containing protein [Erwinia sorbitola]QGU88557.1 BMC domain-containing protein [Erwinia sorbitola]